MRVIDSTVAAAFPNYNLRPIGLGKGMRIDRRIEDSAVFLSFHKRTGSPMRRGEEIKEILLELGPFKPFSILYHYEPLRWTA